MSDKHTKKLGQLAATAICGNDISSSVLYVSALAIFYAGQYAWVTLLIVVAVLFLFRRIYGEVVGAIPLNGGAYNALLNTTSKSLASFAATLTILSYMATAVISANEAMHYLHHLVPSLPIMVSTTILLAFFAFLTIIGITESAIVAIGIFIFHLTSLFLLVAFVSYYLITTTGLTVFLENQGVPTGDGGIGMAILMGFAASMLGVSGFESSANFVEEQEKGVFPKTLRNMWGIVSVINPLIAIFALALFSMVTLKSDQYQNTLLVEMAEHVGGNWLASVIAIDAVLVLSGAVLTSFVGVAGLLERMTLDRIMPQFFLKKNKRGSSYRIIILFFALSVSVLYMTEGNVALLAGVYAISFLAVMALFGIGNILLKLKRSRLPRPEKAGWLSLALAIAAVSVALYGNIIMPPKVAGGPRNFAVFLNYFVPFVIAVAVMLNRTLILKLLLSMIETIFKPIQFLVVKSNRRLLRTIERINQQEFVFFTKGENIASLNKVMQYIEKNEHTKQIKIVTVLKAGDTLPPSLHQEISFLDRAFPDIKIEFVIEEGVFTPQLVRDLSAKYNIPINFMFIGSPTEKFPYRVEELGGVRLII